MFAPGDKLPVHDHPAYPTVFVYLTDGGPIRFMHIQLHTGAKETHIVEYLGDSASEYCELN